MKLKLLQYLYLWVKSKLTSRGFLVLKPFLHWHIKKRDADFHHFETSVDAIKIQSLHVIYLLLTLLHSVTCQKNKTVTILLNQTLSWADGLKECHNRNGTLVSEEEAKLLERNGWSDGNQPGSDYWTGTHQYLSDWLGTLGK